MSSKMILEALNLQAEQLNAGKPAALEAVVNAMPAERAELSALMALAARLKRALAPVLPSPAFRARLRDGLNLAAHHRALAQLLAGDSASARAPGAGTPTESRRNLPQWSWLIGAAALGSAAGLIAVVLRLRHARKGAPAGASPPE